MQPEGDQPSELFRYSAQVDKQLGQLYYSQPEELCARAFEAFVQDATVTNHFLVKALKPRLKLSADFTPKANNASGLTTYLASILPRWARHWRMKAKRIPQ